LSALPPSEKATPAVAFCFFVNRLLDAEPWARERLAPFSGQTVEIAALPLPTLRIAILEGGRLGPGAEAPHLVMRFGPAALFALAGGEDEFLAAVEVSGSEKLAREAVFLARHLRWDVEEALSRVLGDVAARRVAEAARGFAAWQMDAARRVTAAAVDFLAEEARLLVRREDQAAHAHAVADLRDALARLEKRLERLG